MKNLKLLAVLALASAAFAVSACAIVSGVQLPPQQQDFVSSFFLLNSPIIDSS